MLQIGNSQWMYSYNIHSTHPYYAEDGVEVALLPNNINFGFIDTSL